MGGEQYVVREWKKAEIAGVVKDGSTIFPQDPFEEIDNVRHLLVRIDSVMFCLAL